MNGPEIIALRTSGWSNPRLSVLVYRKGLLAGDADAIEALLARSGWRPDWRNGVYPFHHFHSTAHEALACVSGSAELMLGGPAGHSVGIAAGDLIVLPAGTGHCRIGASGDFLLVGAYPNGQDWDVCREPADAAALERIVAVPTPTADPPAGEGGPLASIWRT